MAFKLWAAGSVVAIGLGAFGAANASTIDFSDLGSSSCASLGSSAHSGGFTFTDIGGGGLFLCNAGVLQHNTTPALIAANTTSVLGMSETDGGLFSLQSFFAGSRTQDFNPDGALGGANATGIDVVGTTLSGTVSEHFDFSGLSFSQFILSSDFTGLSSLRITAAGPASPEFAINGIVVNEGGAGGVPEPASWALMLVGFFGAGSMVRSRRTRGAVTA
jgi:hypothetical protein